MKILWTKDLKGRVHEDSMSLRKAVFVEELGGDHSLEFYNEKACEFVVIYDGNTCVGTGRIEKSDGKVAKLQRIAIKKEYRNQGYGKKMILEMERKCKEEGVNKIEMYANINAFDFYKELGYKERGDVFLRSGIKHILMEKEID